MDLRDMVSAYVIVAMARITSYFHAEAGILVV
jgi:hypothetical protein